MRALRLSLVGTVILSLVGGLSVGVFAQGSGEDADGPPGVRALALGYDHTCALLEDGTARCWGDNADGQLGDGTTEGTRVPVAVRDLTGAVDVVAGGYHACALLEDGTARCWGDNAEGQLGDGTTTDGPVPVRVAGLEGATALAAGRTHTCALLEDGTARCWGDTDDGIADTGGTPDRSSLPVPVQGIDDAVGLVAGPESTCALLGDAGVSCWGSLYWGTGPNDVAFAPSPAIVPRTESARDIAIGESHACFLLADASVTCLGRNSEGQLGDGGTDHSRVPVAVRDLVDVTALAAGWYHTCALLEEGTVRCWGGNAEGQLGDGSADDSCPPWSCMPEPDDPSRQVWCDRCGSPIAVGGLEGVVDLETGYERTCALRADDTIACWGYEAAQYPTNCPQDDCRSPVEIDLGPGVEPMASAGLLQSMAPVCGAHARGGVDGWRGHP